MFLRLLRLLLLAGFDFKYIKASQLGIAECISIFLLSVYCRSVLQWVILHSWTASLPVGSADTGGMHTVPQSLLELLQLSARPCDWQPGCVKKSSLRNVTHCLLFNIFACKKVQKFGVGKICVNVFHHDFIYLIKNQ